MWLVNFTVIYTASVAAYFYSATLQYDSYNFEIHDASDYTEVGMLFDVLRISFLWHVSHVGVNAD